MKIVHFLIGRCNPESANGIEKSVSGLTRKFADMSNEVFLFSLTAKEIIEIPGVNVIHIKPSFIPYWVPKILKQKIMEIKPDVVHLHSVYIPQNYCIAKFLSKKDIPYIITPHGGLSPEVFKRKRLVKRLYRMLIELPMLNKASVVHSVGDTDHILKYGVKSEIIQIPNGIELKNFPDELKEDYFIKKYPALSNKRKFLFIGRLDILLKGLDLFLSAYKSCNIKNTHFFIIGPAYKNNLKDLNRIIHDLNLGNFVTIMGPKYGIEKYQALYSCDVFVHTSRSEGLPFSVLEALALKKPCLLTQTANPLGILKNNESCILVSEELNNIQEVVSNSIIIDSGKLKKIGINGFKELEKNFNLDNIANKMIETYKRIVQTNNSYC